MAGFDVFALSSDTEQMPLSVLEAMAAGLPVVATDVGDIRAMVAPENGPFIVPLEDEAMAAGLRGLLADPRCASAWATPTAARRVRDYDQEAMFQAYAALLDGAEPAGR